LTSIIKKRHSLHKDLRQQQEINTALQSQISQLQPLANIGTTTCMIAHEINNLLTPLSSYAALAIKNPDDNSLTQKALQRTLRNCRQAADIMQTMLAVANGENQNKSNLHLRTLVDEVFTCLCRDFAKDRITVKTLIPENLTIYAIPTQIQQLLMNLILNARDAMLKTGGTLTVGAKDLPAEVQIQISDTGPGIKQEHLDKIFQLFFTTKAQQENCSNQAGAGLGLAFCKQVVDAHNGSISVESEPYKKTTFHISLPKHQ